MKQYFFEELTIGQSESMCKKVTAELIEQFAGVSGDTNPLHLDEAYAATTKFKGRIAHGALSSSFISAVLGTLLPGVGAIYLSQSVRYLAPVRLGDAVTAAVTVQALDPIRKRATLKTECFVGDGKVVDGEAQVYVPSSPAP